MQTVSRLGSAVRRSLGVVDLVRALADAVETAAEDHRAGGAGAGAESVDQQVARVCCS